MNIILFSYVNDYIAPKRTNPPSQNEQKYAVEEERSSTGTRGTGTLDCRNGGVSPA
mgnify:CR=1